MSVSRSDTSWHSYQPVAVTVVNRVKTPVEYSMVILTMGEATLTIYQDREQAVRFAQAMRLAADALEKAWEGA